jgi:hypothetical protein
VTIENCAAGSMTVASYCRAEYVTYIRCASTNCTHFARDVGTAFGNCRFISLTGNVIGGNGAGGTSYTGCSGNMATLAGAGAAPGYVYNAAVTTQIPLGVTIICPIQLHQTLSLNLQLAGRARRQLFRAIAGTNLVHDSLFSATNINMDGGAIYCSGITSRLNVRACYFRTGTSYAFYDAWGGGAIYAY